MAYCRDISDEDSWSMIKVPVDSEDDQTQKLSSGFYDCPDNSSSSSLFPLSTWNEEAFDTTERASHLWVPCSESWSQGIDDESKDLQTDWQMECDSLNDTSELKELELFNLSSDIVMRRNFIFLKEEIDPDLLIDDLFESKVLTPTEKEEVCNKMKPRHQRMQSLLTIVLRKNDEEQALFLNSMTEDYKHIPHILSKTTDFLDVCEWKHFQKEITSDHIKANQGYLKTHIEASDVADYMLQELPEEIFPISFHEDIQAQSSKRRKGECLLQHVLDIQSDIVLNCFLSAIQTVRQFKDGQEILGKLRSIDTEADTRHVNDVNVRFCNSYSLQSFPKHSSLDNMIRLKFESAEKRLTDLENRILHAAKDDEIEEITNRLLHLSIKEARPGSVILVVECLTENALQNLSRNQMKAFIRSLLMKSEINSSLPNVPFKIHFEVFTKRKQKDAQEVDGEVISDLEINRSLLLEELEPLRYVDAFSSKLSTSEVEEISNRFQRRERVDLLIDILLKKEIEIQNILYRELKRQNETYIVNNWISSSALLSEEQKKSLRSSILEHFSEISEEIDVRIADRIHTNRQSKTLSVYHDPSCVIRHILKSDIALLKFYNAVKTTCMGGWLKSTKRLGTKAKSHLSFFTKVLKPSQFRRKQMEGFTFEISTTESEHFECNSFAEQDVLSDDLEDKLINDDFGNLKPRSVHNARRGVMLIKCEDEKGPMKAFNVISNSKFPNKVVVSRQCPCAPHIRSLSSNRSMTVEKAWNKQTISEAGCGHEEHTNCSCMNCVGQQMHRMTLSDTRGNHKGGQHLNKVYRDLVTTTPDIFTVADDKRESFTHRKMMTSDSSLFTHRKIMTSHSSSTYQSNTSLDENRSPTER